MTSPIPGLNIIRYQADLQDSDRATAQTIAVMCEQIDRAAKDPVLCAAARDAVRRFRGGPLYASAGINPWSSPQAIAESAWWWVKHALRFVHHDGLIQVWFNERDQLQLLISPDLLLRMQDPRGDCAIYTMLLCAMLKCFGIGYEIVTAAVTPNSPEYDHVWCRAILPNNRRLNLDASHGKYPGWQVPFEHRNRTQVWDESANPILDIAPKHRGLHAYQALARPNTPILPKRLMLVRGVGFGAVRRPMRFRRGLGQDETDESGLEALNEAATASVTGMPISAIITPTSPTYLSNPTPVTNTSGQPSTVGAELTNLASQWTGIASKVLAPTVTYTGPGGVTYSAPATASPSATIGIPTSLSQLSTSAGSLLPLLLIGGLGGLAIFLIMGLSKR